MGKAGLINRSLQESHPKELAGVASALAWQIGVIAGLAEAGLDLTAAAGPG